jgi:hypothetical protein
MFSPEESIDLDSFLAYLNAKPAAYLIDESNIERSRLALDPQIWEAIADDCMVIDVVDSPDVFVVMPGENEALRYLMLKFRFVRLP